MKDGFEHEKNAESTYLDTLDHAVEPDFMALEERIMFDGAMGVEAVDAAVDHMDEATQEPAADPAEIKAAAADMVVPPADRSEIYFIDPSVDNAQSLISAIPAGAEVVVLDGGTDGVQQIASALDGRGGFDAIHILSHGGSGQINLGGTTLDGDSITGDHSDALAQIGSALSDDADILIYGCDFGQDDAVITAFANATGADVAASDNATGAAGLGRTSLSQSRPSARTRFLQPLTGGPGSKDRLAVGTVHQLPSRPSGTVIWYLASNLPPFATTRLPLPMLIASRSSRLNQA